MAPSASNSARCLALLAAGACLLARPASAQPLREQFEPDFVAQPYTSLVIPLGTFEGQQFYWSSGTGLFFKLSVATQARVTGNVPFNPNWLSENWLNTQASNTNAPAFSSSAGLLYVRIFSSPPAQTTLITVNAVTMDFMLNVTLPNVVNTNVVFDAVDGPAFAYALDDNGGLSKLSLPTYGNVSYSIPLQGNLTNLYIDTARGLLYGAATLNGYYPIVMFGAVFNLTGLTLLSTFANPAQTTQFSFTWYHPPSARIYSLVDNGAASAAYCNVGDTALRLAYFDFLALQYVESSQFLPVCGTNLGGPQLPLWDWPFQTPLATNYLVGGGGPIGAIDNLEGMGYFAMGHASPQGNITPGLQWIFSFNLTTGAVAGYVRIGEGLAPPFDNTFIQGIVSDPPNAALYVLATGGRVFRVSTPSLTVTSEMYIGSYIAGTTIDTFTAVDGTSVWVNVYGTARDTSSTYSYAQPIPLASWTIADAYGYNPSLTRVYATPGLYYTFVPWSINNVTVHLWGAGGGGSPSGGTGGGGAYVTGVIADLNDGGLCCDMLQIEVGKGGSLGAQQGSFAMGAGGGSAPGGASGGGRSAIQRIYNLTNSGTTTWTEVVSAAGGGGAGPGATSGGGAGYLGGARGGDNVQGGGYLQIAPVGAYTGGFAGGGGNQNLNGVMVSNASRYGGGSSAPGNVGGMYSGGAVSTGAGGGGGGSGLFGGGAGVNAAGGGGSCDVSGLLFSAGADAIGSAPYTANQYYASPVGVGGNAGGGPGNNGMVVLLLPQTPTTPSYTPTGSVSSSPSSSTTGSGSPSNTVGASSTGTRTRHASHSHTHTRHATHTPAKSHSHTHTRHPSATETHTVKPSHSETHTAGVTHSHTRSLSHTHRARSPTHSHTRKAAGPSRSAAGPSRSAAGHTHAPPASNSPAGGSSASPAPHTHHRKRKHSHTAKRTRYPKPYVSPCMISHTMVAGKHPHGRVLEAEGGGHYHVSSEEEM